MKNQPEAERFDRISKNGWMIGKKAIAKVLRIRFIPLIYTSIIYYKDKIIFETIGIIIIIINILLTSCIIIQYKLRISNIH